VRPCVQLLLSSFSSTFPFLSSFPSPSLPLFLSLSLSLPLSLSFTFPSPFFPFPYPSLSLFFLFLSTSYFPFPSFYLPFLFCCCCCFLLALDQGLYATELGEASIPRVTECYFRFVEQESDEIILIETVAACIFQYRTFSR